MKFHNPDPWYVVSDSSLEEFIEGMLALGTPLETSLVGVFDQEGRGSRRDVDLPLHRDGEYSQKLAEVQGGIFVEKKDIHIVGMFCIREGTSPCVTLLGEEEVCIQKNQALVWDNQRLLHGRRGRVGDRLLLRVWIQRR